MVNIVTVSAADLPIEIANRYDIDIIPANVWFGPHKYIEDKDITKHDFYEMLTTSEYVPRTTHAPPSSFLKVFRKYKGEPTLAILTSPKLSPFYASAEIAINAFNLDHVALFDSGTVSMGLGLQVIIAATMAEQGYQIPDIVERLNTAKKNQALYVLIDTLKYIVRGGRAGKAQEVIAGLLNLKPILQVADGELHPAGTSFGQEKGKEKILQELHMKYQNQKNILASVMFSTNPLDAQDFAAELERRIDAQQLYMARVGSSVGSNVGPNALAVAVIPSPL